MLAFYIVVSHFLYADNLKSRSLPSSSKWQGFGVVDVVSNVATTRENGKVGQW